MRQVGASFLIALCTLVVCQPVLAQPAGPGAAEVEQALASMRPHAIRAHMGFLADDLLEGRRSATRGYDLAAKYVAAQLGALGLEPAGAGGSFFQPVPMVRITTNEPECSLAFLREGRTTELRYWSDYIGGSQDGSITAPVIFAGFGVTAPEAGYDDYAGIDVRGKIVAILFGAPPSFPNDQRAYYSDPRVGARNALAHGAAGMMVMLTPELERMFPWDHVVQNARGPALSWLDEAGRPYRVGPAAAILSPKTADLPVKEAARRLGIEVSPDPIPEQVNFIRSDHYSFVQQGVPAIHLDRGFQTGDPAVDGRALWDTWMQEVYHRPGDDMSQVIEIAVGVQFARLNFLISYLVAQNDEIPSWNPGDFFGEKFRRIPK